MPAKESKSTASRSQLRALKSPKEIEKIEERASSIVRRLVNGQDENAKDLVILATLIRDEPGPDQENLLDKIVQAAFLNSCDFGDILQSWAQEVRGESQLIRKRA